MIQNVTTITCDRCLEERIRLFGHENITEQLGLAGWREQGITHLCPDCGVTADRITIELCVQGSRFEFSLQELADELQRVIADIGLRAPDKSPMQARYLHGEKIRTYVLINRSRWQENPNE